MAKSKQIDEIADNLKKLMQQADIYQPKMEPAIRSAAEVRAILDRAQAKLAQETLNIVEIGSQGQTKTQANPLLIQVKDLQKIYSQKLTELGLTYQTTPSKMRDNNNKDMEGLEPLMGVLGVSK